MQQEPAAVTPALRRMDIDKTFQGYLAAVSKGQLLAAKITTKGSAGRVAIEIVDGTLAGLTGTFVLQPSGTMDRRKPTLSVTVVPDSGTGELVGLSGQMDTRIEDGESTSTISSTRSCSGGVDLRIMRPCVSASSPLALHWRRGDPGLDSRGRSSGFATTSPRALLLATPRMRLKVSGDAASDEGCDAG